MMMITTIKKICNVLCHPLVNFKKREDGTAAVEASLLFPVLITILMGTVDIGLGITINQKVVSSSQIAADLVARHQTITDADINQVVEAARLIFQGNTTTSFGIDIVSLEFDDNQDPVVLWRETRNMSPNNAAVASTAGMFPEGEGMIIVSVQYEYDPTFSGEIINTFTMQEIAFSRGRRNPTVPKI